MNYTEIQQKANESFQQDKYSESVELYEQCIEINPEDLHNYWYLGLALLLQGDESLAQTVWMSVFLQGNPDEIDVWTNDLVKILEEVAVKCIKSKHLTEAEQLCWQIQELKPDSAYTYLGLSSIQIELGEFETAIDTLQKFIALEPNVPNAYHNLGVCLQNLERYREAIPCFQKAIALKTVKYSLFRL